MSARIFQMDRPLIMGHRGHQREAPENTMLSMKLALSVGVDFLESDVRMTKDRELVLFHDDSLIRTTGQQGRVKDYSLDELRQIDLGYTFSTDGSTYPFRSKGHSIVTLREAFDAFPTARFNLDIKDSDSNAPELLAKILREKEKQKSVIIASFIPSQLEKFRKLEPSVATSANPKEVRNFLFGVKLRMIDTLSGTRQYKALQVPIKSGIIRVISKRFIDEAHKRNIAIHVWTINDRSTMEYLIDMEVDGIFTDEPSLMREVLVDRGFL
ncbi:MAG: glycerophosphodiester phosphodiesterase [Candidatus Hodarchaeota archaeon]